VATAAAHACTSDGGRSVLVSTRSDESGSPLIFKIYIVSERRVTADIETHLFFVTVLYANNETTQRLKRRAQEAAGAGGTGGGYTRQSSSEGDGSVTVGR